MLRKFKSASSTLVAPQPQTQPVAPVATKPQPVDEVGEIRKEIAAKELIFNEKFNNLSAQLNSALQIVAKLSSHLEEVEKTLNEALEEEDPAPVAAPVAPVAPVAAPVEENLSDLLNGTDESDESGESDNDEEVTAKDIMNWINEVGSKDKYKIIPCVKEIREAVGSKGSNLEKFLEAHPEKIEAAVQILQAYFE